MVRVLRVLQVLQRVRALEAATQPEGGGSLTARRRRPPPRLDQRCGRRHGPRLLQGLQH